MLEGKSAESQEDAWSTISRPCVDLLLIWNLDKDTLTLIQKQNSRIIGVVGSANELLASSIRMLSFLEALQQTQDNRKARSSANSGLMQWKCHSWWRPNSGNEGKEAYNPTL